MCRRLDSRLRSASSSPVMYTTTLGLISFPPYFFDPLAAYFRKLTFLGAVGISGLPALRTAGRSDSPRITTGDSGVPADLPATGGGAVMIRSLFAGAGISVRRRKYG